MKKSKTEYPPKKPCGGCKAEPGEFHKEGCDWERCPLCGRQMLQDDCIYEISLGKDVDLEEEYPEIFNEGPTVEMIQKYNDHVEAITGWQRHPGWYPGTALAVEKGWYVYWGPPWICCDKEHPEASPDLSRAHSEGWWDREKQRFVTHE